jgi:hypothetical protein
MKNKSSLFIFLSLVILFPNLGCLLVASFVLNPAPMILFIVPIVMFVVSISLLIYGLSLRKK